MRDKTAPPETADHPRGPAGASVMRRLQELVERSRRQEKVENFVWRYFLVLAALIALAAVLVPTLFLALPNLLPVQKHFFVIHRSYEQRGQNAAQIAYARGVAAKMEATGNLGDGGLARQHNISGSAVVRLVIQSDGKLLSALLLRHSGNAILDGEACRIALQSAPFDPFPADMKGMGRTAVLRWMTFTYGHVPEVDLFPVRDFSTDPRSPQGLAMAEMCK